MNTHTTSTVEQALRAYIIETFLYDETDFDLTTDFQLFEERVVDSMGIFRLVSFMNEEFGVIIQPDEIVIENFGTIADMTKLVMGHLQNGAEPQNPFAAFAG